MKEDTKLDKRFKVLKILAVIFWIIPTLIPVLFVLASISLVFSNAEYNLIDKFSYLAFGPIISLVFYTVGFLINIPNWCLITAAAIILKKKQDKHTYLYITLTSNIVLMLLMVLFTFGCNRDCQSDSALGSGFSWAFGFFLGNLFWTLPFSYFVTKKV